MEGAANIIMSSLSRQAYSEMKEVSAKSEPLTEWEPLASPAKPSGSVKLRVVSFKVCACICVS